MHCAERWILLSKMKYKLLCCFSIIFLNVKKHNYKANPCQNFQFFRSHTGPRFPFFEAFFVAAPPSNKEERGENFWENIRSVFTEYCSLVATSFCLIPPSKRANARTFSLSVICPIFPNWVLLDLWQNRCCISQICIPVFLPILHHISKPKKGRFHLPRL